MVINPITAEQQDKNYQKRNRPDTSLLICSRNRAQLLWETIQSVLAGQEIPTEIVVIDQSDIPDHELSVFRPEQNCTVRYLWSEKKGVSLGRNMAIAAATHPILVILDDDMLVEATWYGSLIQSLLAGGTDSVITGRVRASKETEEGFAPSIAEDGQTHVYHGRVMYDILSTGNMAIYRSAFERVGQFDEQLGPGTRYPAAEDNDFGFRLLEAGYTIIYEPGAVVYHRSWRSKEDFLQLHWGYGLGQGAFYAKYFSWRDTFTLRRLIRAIGNHVIRFPFRLLFDRPQAFRDYYFITGLLTGAVQWTMQQRDRRA